jgi:hypothetical protein
MSDTKKVALDFNTAITGLNPDTGKWDEKVHNETVMPLRGLIMQIDGAVGCFIARYAVEVTYVPSVTDRTLVIEAVQAAVREVSVGDNFFPLRGAKIPAASVPEPAQPTYATWWVARVTFDTDLFVDREETSTTKIVDDLTTRLANADGARQPGVGQRMLYVRFDERHTSPARMRAHLEKVVGEIMGEGRRNKEYFPFGEPVFSYEEYATSSVI